ncbi:hypothetical protein FOZ63_016480, partial [Perkinsus olseni]
EVGYRHREGFREVEVILQVTTTVTPVDLKSKELPSCGVSSESTHNLREVYPTAVSTAQSTPTGSHAEAASVKGHPGSLDMNVIEDGLKTRRNSIVDTFVGVALPVLSSCISRVFATSGILGGRSVFVVKLEPQHRDGADASVMTSFPLLENAHSRIIVVVHNQSPTKAALDKHSTVEPPREASESETDILSTRTDPSRAACMQ